MHRQRTKEQRAAIVKDVERQRAQGVSVRDATKSHRVNATTYYGWLKHAAPNKKKSTLRSIVLTEPTKDTHAVEEIKLLMRLLSAKVDRL